MIARIGSGWQYVLADLSLILFMVTAAAVCEVPSKVAASEGLANGEPVAVWRAGPGAPSLGEWLSAQPTDPRQRLTLVFHGAPSAALPAFEAALKDIADEPRPLRLTIEPGEGGPFEARIAYDLSLQSEGTKR